MRRIAAALLTLAMGLWAVAVLAAPVPTYPLTPPPYNSTAALLGSQSGQVINFPLWAPGQTLINGTPVPGHCSIWVTGTNGLQLGDGGSGCGAGGTVSSVGLTMPEPFACSGSPVTTSGTIICTIDASPNTVLAGPPTGSGGGTNFRALVTADLPNSGVTPGTYPCLTGVISAAGTITDAESNMCGDVSVYFGTGAPSTIYSQGDLYFDVSETPFNTYVQYFGTGTSPSQEGSTSATCCAGTTTSVGAEISTSSSNLLLAYVINYSSTPTVIPVAGITDTNGHTFHKYTSAISGNANQTDAELWCATISGPNASDTVTATFGTATNAGIALIGIENAQTGANCATASFDTNGSWPLAINGGSPTSATVSTSVPNDLALFAVASSSSGTGIPSGFTSIYNLPGSFHSPSAQVGAESLSAVWSSQSVSWPTPTDNGPVIMAAIAGDLGSQQWFQYGNSGLSAIGADELLANITGSSAVPVGNTLTSIIDAALCSTRGAILERGSSGWGCITPGTSTYVLTSNGSGADPSYQAASGGGSLAVQQGGSTIVAGATTLNFASGATVTSGGSGVANVAISGGGGGSDYPSDYTGPAVGTFAWFNQNSSSAAQSSSIAPIELDVTQTGSCCSWSVLYQTMGSTPWRVRVKLSAISLTTASPRSFGLYVGDGTKLEGLEPCYTCESAQDIRVEHMASGTTDSGHGYELQKDDWATFKGLWEQVRDDGTNIYWDVCLSSDVDCALGEGGWFNLYTESVGSWITPTTVGVGGDFFSTPGSVFLQQWIPANTASLN